MVNEQKEDHVVGQLTRSPVEWNPVEGKDALRWRRTAAHVTCSVFLTTERRLISFPVECGWSVFLWLLSDSRWSQEIRKRNRAFAVIW